MDQLCPSNQIGTKFINLTFMIQLAGLAYSEKHKNNTTMIIYFHYKKKFF